MGNRGRKKQQRRRGLRFIMAAVLTLGFVLVGGVYAVKAEESAVQPAGAAENGLILSKTAEYDTTTDSACIQLEAYVTGTVTTEIVEEDIPCDIVLALDFSGSMLESSGTDGVSRSDALQNAVNYFIDTIHEKYDANGADHQITLVTFSGQAATVRNDWTDVSDANVEDLKIEDPEKTAWKEAGTPVNLGMDAAYTQLLKLGSEELRSKAVVLFTDGEMSYYRAVDSVNRAKQMKEMGCAVYTVATSTMANVTRDLQLTEGGVLQEENGSDEFDPRYVNAVMHAISSNYPEMTAAQTGTKEQIQLSNITIDSKVDANGNGKVDDGEEGFYLVADTSDSLNTVFQSIASSIQSGAASMELGSSTVVKDVVSDYFDLPVNTSAVTVKTYDCITYDEQTGDATWSTAGTDLSDVVTLDSANKTVNVTGFDFSKNFVSQNGRDEADAGKTGDFHGRKIVITFYAPVRAGFLGGNAVPTNGSATGVYSGSTLIEDFEQPVVDVPVKTPVVSAPDYNVYLLGGKTEEQLKAGTTVTAAGQTVSIDPAASNFGLQSWQNDFINITVGTISGFDSLTADAAYPAVVTFTPKNTGKYESTSGTDTGNLYVYKPVITYSDSTIVLGDTADYEKENFAGVVWMHDSSAAPADMGTAPALNYTYSPVAAAFQEDTSVKVSVKLGTTDVTGHTAFYRNGCTYNGCSNKTQAAVSGTDDGRVNFVVHVLRYDLTIAKQVAGLPEGKIPQSFTFQVVDAKNYTHTVSVSNNGSATITVPAGTATVTETKTAVDGYDLAVKAGGTDVTNGTSAVTTVYPVNGAETVTFTNTYVRQTGTLAVTKQVTGDIPANRIPDSFSITVTGPEGYRSTQAVKNGQMATFTDIPTGTVTITEDTGLAAVEHYTLRVTGSGKTAAITNGKIISHTVTNAYTRKTADVTITKTVSGNTGDRNEGFSFTVTVKDTDNSTLSFTHNGKTVNTATFSLKHGQTASLTGVPVGAVVTVREESGKYKASATVNGAAATVTNGSLRFVVLDTEADSIVVNNERSALVDTGVVLDVLPYVLILAGVIASCVFLFAGKRKYED